ncbi:MAG: Clp protease N-terminal domain-containing protein, partial [Hyphomicrobiaceae bacterium]
MSQSFAEALSWVPVSATFSGTLGRAHEYARAQGHRTVTLEHLLLALAEDPDANTVLQASNIDVARVMSDASTHLGHHEDRFPPGQPVDPGADDALIKILDYAAAAARQSRRREINGAIVLAAIVGEGRSVAASMLQAQGLTFEGAIKALQRAPAAGPQPPRPASPQTAMPAPGPATPQPAAPKLPIDQQATINGAATQTNEQILASVRRRIDANRNT